MGRLYPDLALREVHGGESREEALGDLGLVGHPENHSCCKHPWHSLGKLILACSGSQEASLDGPTTPKLNQDIFEWFACSGIKNANIQDEFDTAEVGSVTIAKFK